MPRRKDKTPGADQVRERVLIACRFIVAKRIDGITSNSELCKALGIADARMTEWEKKQGHPTVEVLYDLQNIFGIGGNWMLSGKGAMRPGDPDVDLLAGIRRLLKR